MNENILKVMEQVKLAKRFLIIENGTMHNSIIDKFLDYMNNYSIYCKENKRERWLFLIRKIVYTSGFIDDNTVYNYIYCFIIAGKIMKLLAENKSIDSIINLIEKRNYSNEILFTLGQILLEFSYYGSVFTNYMLHTSDKDFKKEVKEYIKTIKPPQRIRIICY